MKKIIDSIKGVDGCLLASIGGWLIFFGLLVLIYQLLVEVTNDEEFPIEIITSVEESKSRLIDAAEQMHLNFSKNDYIVEENLLQDTNYFSKRTIDITYVFNNGNVISDIVKSIDSLSVLHNCWEKENDSIYAWSHKGSVPGDITENALLNLNNLKLTYSQGWVENR
tara:strand:+ start:115 stop:615 length:501 start_codon:yes stop_codon:yes gene_type:complete